MGTKSATIQIVVNGKDNASKPIKGINSAIGSLGKAAKIGLASTAAGLAAVGLAAAKATLDAAPLEGIKGSFYAIAEAAGTSGDAILEAFQKSTGGALSNRDAMLAYNKAAQLVGDNMANALPEAMGYLSKVAASTGQDLDYMVDSLITGTGRMSKPILDNLNLLIDLEAANEAWAKANGKAVSQMTDAEKQTALLDQVMLQLKENTANMPDTLESAAVKLQAIKAGAQNAKDALGLALLPVFSPIINKVGEFVGGLEPLINAINAVATDGEGGFAQFWNDIPEFMQPAAAALIDITRKVKDAIEALKNGDIEGALANFVSPEMAAKIVEIGGKIKGFVDDSIIPFIDKIKEAAEILKEGDISGALSTFIPWQVADNIEDLIETIGRLVNDTFIPFVQQHADDFKAAFIGIGIALGGLALVSTIGSIAGVLATLVSPVGLLIAGAALLGVAWNNNWGGIQEKTDAVITFVRDEIITPFLDWINTFWSENGEKIKQTVADMWDGIKNFINERIEKIKEIIDLFKLAGEGKWYEFGEKLRELTDEAWQKITDFFGSLWNDKIKPKIDDLINNFKGRFSGEDWQETGKNVLRGIADGILAMKDWVVEKAVEVAGAIGQAVKGFFGIESPSRVFAEMGRMNMLGLAAGMNEGQGDAVAAAQSAVSGVMGGLWNGVSMDTATAIGFIQNNVIAPFTTWLPTAFNMSLTMLRVGTVQSWQLISQTFTLSLQAIKLGFIAFKTAFGLDWTALCDDMKLLWSNAWDEIIRKMILQNRIILSLLKGVRSAAVTEFSETDWAGVGNDMMQGIAAGIKGGASAAISAAVQASLAALQAAKLALGISSPSKAFAEIGKWNMQGLAAGMTDNIGAPVKAATTAAATVTGAAIARPGNSTGSSGGHNVVIHINGAQDAEKVAREVADMLSLQGVTF